MTVPAQPKLYHIVHVDRLASIVSDGHLWCDAEVQQRHSSGTTIGQSDIKQRRLQLALGSHPGLHVGDCVPFYFCPRSVMLYMIHKGNDPRLSYRGGQGPIVHLVVDLHAAVTWADQNHRRWAFTLSNAGSNYFEDRCDVAHLGEIDWDAVEAHYWQVCIEGKQAEFLLERSLPWQLVEGIGVLSQATYQQVVGLLPSQGHQPSVAIRRNWYY